MKNCKKCDKKFEPIKGLINYCSLECRNSRTWSDEDKLKKSEAAKKSDKVLIANRTTIRKTKERKIKNPNFWFEIKEERSLKRKTLIMSLPYEDLKFEILRERIIYEQDCKCNKCGLDKWLGETIPLEIEHKDGNHFNNDRNNLEMLCPNCHAMTKTWRGRNKKRNNIGKISDEKLLEILLINDWNMRKSLIELELAPKGGNYKRCHRLKKEYNELTTSLS